MKNISVNTAVVTGARGSLEVRHSDSNAAITALRAVGRKEDASREADSRNRITRERERGLSIDEVLGTISHEFRAQ
jgi:hypothetical protein